MDETSRIVAEVMRSIACGFLIAVTLTSVVLRLITRYFLLATETLETSESDCRDRSVHGKVQILQDLSMLVAHVIIRAYLNSVELSVMIFVVQRCIIILKPILVHPDPVPTGESAAAVLLRRQLLLLHGGVPVRLHHPHQRGGDAADHRREQDDRHRAR